jgi:hypothetical protein
VLGDRTHHVFVEIDMLDVDIGYLDASGVGVGLLIDDLLNVSVEPIPFRELAGRGQKVRDLDNGSLRVDDTEVEDGRSAC